MDQPSAIPVRTSGIPRPTSRLPVLRSAGSQSQLRSPSSSDQLRKKASISSISRTSQPPAPTLQKRASRSSLVRSNTPSTAASTTTTSSSRTSVLLAKRAAPGSGQARTSTPDAAVFKKPSGRPLSRQTKAAPQPPGTANTSREDDVLGDLDAFSSASRASSRASSRAGFHDSGVETVVENEEATLPAPVTGKSRPSLSDRTIASLSHLPSSPAGGKGRRRRSSFFNADNSMPPPLRPASALSNGGRPMTSDGTPRAAPTTPRKLATPTQRGSMTAPGKRSVSAALTPSASVTPSKTSSIVRPPSTIKKQPLSQMHNIQPTPKPRPLSNSKTMVARTPKARASIAGAFSQAISPPGTAVTTTPAQGKRGSVVVTPDTSRKVSSSSAALREQIAKAKATRRSDVTPNIDETPPKTKSSTALREQIAKAKEAARRANSARDPQTDTPPRDPIVPDPAKIAEFDFGLEDPFNQRAKGGKSLLRKRIDGARVDGRLNISAMGLDEVPAEVLEMYSYDQNNDSIAWGEVVDLTVIVAADNEFQALPDAMFPDVDVESSVDADDTGPQFGGVQSIDLHGNLLRELPMGLRRLTQLSKLNLSRNKLSLQSVDVICQIPSLRELKLAENEIEGDFPICLGELSQLEVIELQGNKISSLPPEIRSLTHLRTLNISDNRFDALPTELFTSVPIIELVASKNAFSGAFFDVDTVPHLQKLQLSHNSLTTFCKSGTILLPALQYLNLSGNQLSALPDMSSWTSLNTLLVGENRLSALPDGFLSLQQLRSADFTGNDLNKLDERIALMEGLETLTLAANPLRDRKFLTMNTEDIKRDLSSRIEPAARAATTDALEGVNELGIDAIEDAHGWKLTPSGTLDLSFQNFTEIDQEAIASFAETNDIRQLYLQQNYLTSIPAVTAQLSFLSVLDLSRNNIVSPLADPLELPKLRELRLHGNKISSFDAITSYLTAPNLQHLDVSNNHIAGSLPVFRMFFPELIRFVASDNSIAEVPAEALQGLKIVNLSNNDIGRLEPEIGLHQGTLTGLDVEGNKFRVPNYAVLRKGTDAILTWLRDKIPSPTEEFFHPGSPGF